MLVAVLAFLALFALLAFLALLLVWAFGALGAVVGPLLQDIQDIPLLLTILFAVDVDVVRVALGMLADEQGNGLFDQSLDLAGTIVPSAEIQAGDGFGSLEVVARACTFFQRERIRDGLRGRLHKGEWLASPSAVSVVG